MALSIQHLLKATFGPAKMGIVKRAYDEFYNTIPIKLCHVSRSLPTNEYKKSTFFAVHCKIKSEKVDMYYDVVIQYLTDTNPSPNTLIRCYCNSPSFGFFFAYVYNRWDALIFKPYYNVQLLTQPPKVRNPKKIPEADKYIYACLRYTSSKRITYNSIDKFNMTDWTKNPVIPFDEILKQRKQLQKQLRPSKRKNKR